MENQALVVVDIQNDLTKNYKDIIDSVNRVIDTAWEKGLCIIYIKHHNLAPEKTTFKPGTPGVDFVPDLKVVSDILFIKTESNALSNADFVNFIREQVLTEFYVTGGDALGCVKATCCALREAGHTVHALSDCITSYDKERLPEMFDLYREVGCIVESSQTAFSL